MDKMSSQNPLGNFISNNCKKIPVFIILSLICVLMLCKNIENFLYITATAAIAANREPVCLRKYKVHAVGIENKSYFYNQLTGSFDICYEQEYLQSDQICEYTDSLVESNVVIIRGIRLANKTVRDLTLNRTNPDQYWIFWESEPPPQVWKRVNLSEFDGLFNLTATYSISADIPNINRRLKYFTRNATLYQQLNQDYTRKKRSDVLVAWIVSHCRTKSLRERYVNALQKHIKVDIFGRCGQHTCEQGCQKRILHQNNSYKFYLSFENSICEDYVTEKLWNLMQMDVVPIVMGGADYQNMLPKDSYIDIKDYPKPEELADYLMYLNNNNKLYNQYIRNKNSLMYIPPGGGIPVECSLCRRLHELQGMRKIIYDLAGYWGTRQCMTYTEYFSERRPDNFNDFLPELNRV